MTTTIKVDSALRDRLKRQASAKRQTLGAHLADLADQADRDAAMRDLAHAIAATPPELMDSWRQETAAWEQAELTDLRNG
jgi:phosphoserine phosphatase